MKHYSKDGRPTEATKDRPRRSEGGVAPNIYSVVLKAMNDHPEVNRMGEDNERGKIVDYAAIAANGGSDKPWGRKSRGRPGADMLPVNPNGDGLTYLLPDGRFEIYDVISGVDGSATWDYAGTFNQGENGFWSRAIGSSVGPVATHRYDGGGNDTGTCDRCSQSRFADVHKVPEGKQPHTYDGGEQDTGLCDICSQARAATIHGSITPGGSGTVEERLATVERTLASVAAKGGETATSLESLARKVQELQESDGEPADTAALRDAVATILKGLEVDIEVQPNGSGFLRHGHGDKTTIRLDGIDLAKRTRTASPWDALIQQPTTKAAPTVQDAPDTPVVQETAVEGAEDDAEQTNKGED